MAIQDEISRVENALRSVIESVMKVRHGDQWSEPALLGVTAERKERWEERRVEAEKHATGAVAESRLLYYSDFPDLGTIVFKNWDLFKPCFGDKKETEVYLDRLNELRNPTAHSRPVLPHEDSLAAGMSRELRQKITVFRNSGAGGPEPEHFARIEEVTDSCGYRAGGRASGEQIIDTREEMTLRPGDVIEFQGSAVDPHGRPMRWRVSSPFRAGAPWCCGTKRVRRSRSHGTSLRATSTTNSKSTSY
jgi:hypothetical protein